MRITRPLIALGATVAGLAIAGEVAWLLHGRGDERDPAPPAPDEPTTTSSPTTSSEPTTTSTEATTTTEPPTTSTTEAPTTTTTQPPRHHAQMAPAWDPALEPAVSMLDGSTLGHALLEHYRASGYPMRLGAAQGHSGWFDAALAPDFTVEPGAKLELNRARHPDDASLAADLGHELVHARNITDPELVHITYPTTADDVVTAHMRQAVDETLAYLAQAYLTHQVGGGTALFVEPGGSPLSLHGAFDAVLGYEFGQWGLDPHLTDAQRAAGYAMVDAASARLTAILPGWSDVTARHR